MKPSRSNSLAILYAFDVGTSAFSQTTDTTKCQGQHKCQPHNCHMKCKKDTVKNDTCMGKHHGHKGHGKHHKECQKQEIQHKSCCKHQQKSEAIKEEEK